MKTRRRPPPAFQVYAADLIADRNFKLMSLGERGLFLSMQLEAWVNVTIPCSARDMARALGLECAEVEAALTHRVLTHFEECSSDDGPVFICPELNSYREHLDQRHAAMSAGGTQSVRKLNQQKSNRHLVQLADEHPVSHPDRPLSRAKQSKAEQSKADIYERYNHEHNALDCTCASCSVQRDHEATEARP
jgi:hypothetical protein